MSPRGVDDLAIARWRFRTLLLDGASAPDASSAVRSLLAVQAENPEQTAWALAARTTGLTRTGLADLVAAGELVRLHVLRPTWHLVHRDDVRWLLELTGPRVRHQVGRQLERDLGLPPERVAALGDLVEQVLTDAPDRTRDEVADALRAAGEELTGTQLMVLLAHLELGLRVGSGRPRPDGGVGRHTYAPLAGRLPASDPLDRVEALGELARRYAVGHGPVTERDLAYWATLPLGDVRAGLAAVADDLGSFEHDGRTWWHAPGRSRRRARGRHACTSSTCSTSGTGATRTAGASSTSRGGTPWAGSRRSGCSSSTRRSRAPRAAPSGAGRWRSR